MRVWGLVCEGPVDPVMVRIWGLGIRARVSGFGFRVSGSRFKVLCFGFRDQGLRFRV